MLTAVRERISRAERDCRLEREAAEEAVAEYEGEVDRLEQVLARAGPGGAEALAQGRAQSYCQVLLHSELCCVIKFKYVIKSKEHVPSFIVSISSLSQCKIR